jgi:hypothetical protein
VRSDTRAGAVVIRVALALAALLASSASVASPRALSKGLTARDGDVYRAALDSVRTPGKTIILLDSTGYMAEWVRDMRATLQDSTGLPADLTDRFRAINQQKARIDSQFFTGRQIRVIPFRDLPFSTSRPVEMWPRFRRLYPDAEGVFRLSRVAYNDDGTRAVVIIESGCGYLCGVGRIVVLTRKLDGWSVTELVEIWQA